MVADGAIGGYGYDVDHGNRADALDQFPTRCAFVEVDDGRLYAGDVLCRIGPCIEEQVEGHSKHKDGKGVAVQGAAGDYAADKRQKTLGFGVMHRFFGL